MESSRSDVWNQSEGKCTLARDAMRDFVAIPYNARGALMPYQSFGLDKKIPRTCSEEFFSRGYEKDIFRGLPQGFELQRYAYEVILIQCDKLGDWFRKWL